MKTYEVIISELRARTYHIKAKNKDEAEEKYYSELLNHEKEWLIKDETIDEHVEEVNVMVS